MFPPVCLPCLAAGASSATCAASGKWAGAVEGGAIGLPLETIGAPEPAFALPIGSGLMRRAETDALDAIIATKKATHRTLLSTLAGSRVSTILYTRRF